MTNEKLVHDALDNAKENGYFDSGMELCGADVHYIAHDLIYANSDFNACSADSITAHVKTWMTLNGL